MTANYGLSANVSDNGKVTTYTVNSSTAIDIRLPVNIPIGTDDTGMYFRVELAYGTNDRDVYLRPYQASQDNIKHGVLLRRRLDEDGSVNAPAYEQPVNDKNNGYWSAISRTGTVDIHVIEY